MKANILIFYHSRFIYPMRRTFEEHLYSFEKYSNTNVYYVNTAFGIPKYIFKISFDLVIIHSLYIAHFRWRGITAEKSCLVKNKINQIDAVKIALPQDEFFHTKNVEELFLKLGIDHIYSVADSSQWQKIYPNINPSKITHVLTGYLDEKMVEHIEKLSTMAPTRNIDIGYRAWAGGYWAGKHATMKGEIAKVFLNASKDLKINTDISTDDRDLFLGDSWYDFMLRCKYLIGIEGGSSLLDPDGSIKQKVESFIEENPKASYDETERHCFPGKEGSLQLKALSPRHLEACVTKTCQVLVEGDYSGVLKPGKHYIELKNDYSNLSEVLEKIKSDKYRKSITETAYQDIVTSKKWTYQHFVKTILGTSLKEIKQKAMRDRFYYCINRCRERCLWVWIAFEAKFYKFIKNFILKFFPKNLILKILTFRARCSK